jgi:hypothetical protein
MILRDQEEQATILRAQDRVSYNGRGATFDSSNSAAWDLVSCTPEQWMPIDRKDHHRKASGHESDLANQARGSVRA